MSPLTPPPLTVRPASPRTPPLPPNFNKKEVIDTKTLPPNSPLPPPPGEEDLQLQEEIIPISGSSARLCMDRSEVSTHNNATSGLNAAREDRYLEKNNDAISSIPSNLPVNEPPLPPEREIRRENTPPPPPPDNTFSKPASPLTSPIGSSPDDMEEPLCDSIPGYSSHSVMASDLRTPRQMQSQYQRAAILDTSAKFHQGDTQSSVSASDISDTDLPDASAGTISEDNNQEIDSKVIKENVPEDDLDLLEKAKAKIQAQLAATNIEDGSKTPMDDSDGEVHTDDSSDYIKKFREIASGGKLHTNEDEVPASVRHADEINPRDSSMSPISSEGPTPEPTKEKHEQSVVTDDHAQEKINYRKKDPHDDDDDNEDKSFSKNSVSGNTEGNAAQKSTSVESQDGKPISENPSSKDGHSKERHHSSSR